MAKKKSETPRRYRILTHQEHSVGLHDPASFAVTVGEFACRVFFRPSQTDPNLQRTQGGTLVQLEFDAAESDLLRAASLGSRLTEDVLAGLALVTGEPFGGVSFVHLVDTTVDAATPFVFLLAPRHLHTDRLIDESDISHLRAVLAHWDHLPRATACAGQRGCTDGLFWKTMTFPRSSKPIWDWKPWNQLLPRRSGSLQVLRKRREIAKHAERSSTRRRTVLNGVRAFIRGAKHPDPASTEQREKEWKQINGLRQELFHSLADLEKLSSKCRTVVATAAHYLHDALCCLSHTHDLETATYRLPRGPKQFIMIGAIEPGIQDALEECRPVITLKELGWDLHPKHGFVPRANLVHDRRNADIGGDFFWLTAPLDVATESDLRPAKYEALPFPGLPQ